MVRRRIEILDTTLRDGGKLPFAVLTLKDRVALARRLARLGVDVIEAGYPVSSPEEAECVAAVAAEVEGTHVAALARCAARDMEPTLRTLEGTDRPYLHLFMPVSAHALAGVVKRSAEEALGDIQACIRIGREAGARVAFSPSEAPQADRKFLGEALAACREAGADVFDIADTNGTLSPAGAAEMAAWACALAGADGPVIGIHCHDDLGLAAANTLAALQAGASHAEVTLGGVGERAGNAALEQLAVLLEAFGPDLGLDHGIKLEELWGAARLLEALTGVRAHPNAPLIGEAALATTPGSHARRALEPRLRGLLEPRTVGRPPGAAARSRPSSSRSRRCSGWRAFPSTRAAARRPPAWSPSCAAAPGWCRARTAQARSTRCSVRWTGPSASRPGSRSTRCTPSRPGPTRPLRSR